MVTYEKKRPNCCFAYRPCFIHCLQRREQLIFRKRERCQYKRRVPSLQRFQRVISPIIL